MWKNARIERRAFSMSHALGVAAMHVFGGGACVVGEQDGGLIVAGRCEELAV